jgi:hypothetical protein
MENNSPGIAALARIFMGEELSVEDRRHLDTLAEALPPYDNAEPLIAALNELLRPHDLLVVVNGDLNELRADLGIPQDLQGWILAARPIIEDARTFVEFFPTMRFVVLADSNWDVRTPPDLPDSGEDDEPLSKNDVDAADAMLAHARVMQGELVKVMAVLEGAYDTQDDLQASLLELAKGFLSTDRPPLIEDDPNQEVMLVASTADLALRTLADQLGMRYETVLGIARRRS